MAEPEVIILKVELPAELTELAAVLSDPRTLGYLLAILHNGLANHAPNAVPAGIQTVQRTAQTIQHGIG